MFLSILIILGLSLFCWCWCFVICSQACPCCRRKNVHVVSSITSNRREANETADIWNISGRVNQPDGPVTSEPQRWPTHDHHVSLDTFVIPETHQPNRKDRIPPPPYSEVDLPTYEEATSLPQPKDELVAVHVVASSSRNCDASTS